MNGQVIWSPGVTLDALERQVIIAAFQAFGKNKTATANALGISVRTLDNKFEQYAEMERKEIAANADQRRKEQDFLARCRGTRPEIVNEPPRGFAPPSGDTFEGDDVESTVKPSKEYDVSVSKRQEIQKLPLGKVAKSR